MSVNHTEHIRDARAHHLRDDAARLEAHLDTRAAPQEPPERRDVAVGVAARGAIKGELRGARLVALHGLIDARVPPWG